MKGHLPACKKKQAKSRSELQSVKAKVNEGWLEDGSGEDPSFDALFNLDNEDSRSEIGRKRPPLQASSELEKEVRDPVPVMDNVKAIADAGEDVG